jgi:mono/diheme cytochrome c family protein
MRPAVAVLFVFALAATAQEKAGKTVWDGVYTADQAKRGEATFSGNCRKCHSTGFYRTGFVERWREEKLTGFFNWISTMMPRDRPGALNQNDYLDIAAYIMSNNDVPAGSQELTIDALTTIQVQRKDGPAPLPDGTLVRVVGCLTQEPDKSWRLTKASAPAHTRVRDASTDSELKVSQGQTPGTNTFGLAYINAFMPDSHKGHKVEAKGDLDRSNGERIMLSSVQTLAPSCE